jgi:hypothetical protein
MIAGLMRASAGSERIRERDRATRHARLARAWLVVGAIALAVGVGAFEASAAPLRAKGQAKASETKSPSLGQTRDRALRRARRAALESALGQLAGPVDPAARKAVLETADAWTGAYRVLSEQSDGKDVSVELEVEIDLVRLQKRVSKREAGGGGPAWALGDVGSAEGCGEAAAVAEAVRSELSAQGAVQAAAGEGEGEGKKTKAKQGKTPALDVALDCLALGPVDHTYLHAVRVKATATADGRTIAEASVPAFATTPAEAVTAGIQGALSDVVGVLGQQGGGRVRLRVQSPMPAVRVRRLEAAMRNSMAGVDEVEVGAVGKGVVELHVRGELSAKALSRALGQLSLPGFSLTIVRVEAPDVVTVRLQ